MIQPSFSGLFVTWAYFPHTTFPPLVTRPSSLILTSKTVPCKVELTLAIQQGRYEGTNLGNNP